MAVSKILEMDHSFIAHTQGSVNVTFSDICGVCMLWNINPAVSGDGCDIRWYQDTK